MKGAFLGIATVLLLQTMVVSQENPEPANRQLAAFVLGPPLVAWSEMQSPHPVVQTSLSCEPECSQATPEQFASAGVQAEPSTRVFVGVIIKKGNAFTLQTLDGVSYRLDDQDQSRLHDGKQVRITGWIDGKTNVLHVASVEILAGQKR